MSDTSGKYWDCNPNRGLPIVSDELKRSLSLSGYPDGGMVYDYYLRAMMPLGVSMEMRLRDVFSDVSFDSVLNKSPG